MKIEEITIGYSQKGDNCGGEEIQDLEISTQDGGGGKFFVIKTERWAFEKPEELMNLLKDFQKRLNLKTTYVDEI